MTVRRAKQKDAPRVAELLRVIAKLHSDGRPDIFKPTAKHGEEDVRRMIADPDNIIFVAEDGSGILSGYLIAKLKTVTGHHLLQDSRVLWIDDFCVAENARGKGCGKELSNAAKQYAIRERCGRLELNVWRFNEGAVRFYEHFGMTPQRTVMEMNLFPPSSSK